MVSPAFCFLNNFVGDMLIPLFYPEPVNTFPVFMHCTDDTIFFLKMLHRLYPCQFYPEGRPD